MSFLHFSPFSIFFNHSFDFIIVHFDISLSVGDTFFWISQMILGQSVSHWT